MQIDSAPSDGSVPIKQEEASHSSWQNFPNGLRVLVVDDDPLCLKVIEQMLRRCNYEVHTCANGAAALEQLRDKSHGFDLVLSDVYMPDMDGFKLLEAIGLELDLPVIMMSSNGEHSTVLRGVTHGAVDFLIKPVRIEELRNIWQHVIRRSGRHAASSQMQSSGEMDHDDLPNEAETCRKRKDAGRESASEREEDSSASKKPRVVWSAEMHLQFVHAVNQLGIDKAVPKKILEIMKVDGLTRENVASHLQKYRLYLKRVQGVSGGHQHGAKGSGSKAAAGAGSSPPMQQQQQHHNGVQAADMGMAAAPGMVPVQPAGATPFAAAAATTVPLPGAGVAGAPTPAVPPVMLQQQGSSMLPAAAGVPPATSQAPTAAAAALPAGMPPMGGLLPAGMMPGVMAGMQPGVAAMQMNALMSMGMGGLGLPGMAMPPPGAGPMLGSLGPMGLPAMGLGALPGMPGLQPPNLPGMGLGMPQVPGMPLGQGMMNPADPNAIMMAFQAMLQAGGRPPPAAGATSSMGTASGSTVTPSMAAVGLPAASTIPSIPSMTNVPGAAGPVMGGAAAGDAGLGMQPLASSSAALPAVGGSLAGGMAMEGLGSPLGADKLLPDVMDFSTMFEDGFNGPGAPGSSALGAGDIGGGVDEFLDMLLQG